MNEEMKVAMNFVKEAEKNIGALPMIVKMEAIPNIINVLSERKSGESVRLWISSPKTGKVFAATVHCC